MHWLRKYLLQITFVVSALILGFQNFTSSPWKEQRVLQEDAMMYYFYLRATFIDDNPFFEERFNEEGKRIYYPVYTSEKGGNVLKMSMGVAYLELPFFALAHQYALHISKQPADGVAPAYQFGISLSTLFYSLLGIFFLMHYLRSRFSDIVVALTLILIVFGSNLYYYITYETGMSHPITFFLLSALLFFSDKWLEQKESWRSLLIGILIGWIVLVRPVNLFFLLPIFFFLKKEKAWNVYLRQLFNPISPLILAFLGAFLIWLPQLLFWKYQTGQFLFYSYGEEGFFWSNPHIWEGLFSFRKGWFIYTPIMLFALIGMLPLYKNSRNYFWGITLFMPLFLYITFSWWSWWYGGGFGARTMIDIYPFLALPFAAFLEWVFAKKLRLILLVSPLLFLALNQYQSWQYKKGILHYDGMTFEAYKFIFLKNHTPVEYWDLLRRPDYDSALQNKEEVNPAEL